MSTRLIALVAGIVVLLAGLTFFLQGINVLPGSVMTGDPFWAWAGLALIVVGAIAAVVGWRSGHVS